MFKKVFQTLSKTFGSKTADSPVPQTIRSAPPSFTGDGKFRKKAQDKSTAMQTALPEAVPSPEDLCGIKARMTKDEIKKRLATLYRRYNRAASSLDASMRAESETMLDAIVMIREKHFDPI